MRVLIVKTSSMGDVVHALPAITDWKRHRPADEIDWLVEPPFAAIPELHSGVHQVHKLAWRKWRRQLFQKATWQAMGQLTRELKARQYDWVIDLQGLLKSAFWARQAGAPVAGYDRQSLREPLAACAYQQRCAVATELHAVQRCRQLVAAVGGWSPQGQPEFGLQVAQPFQHSGLNGSYAVLIPNASRPEKHWPDADWQAVGRTLAAQGLQPVVLWGSPAEERMAQHIAHGCGGWVPPFLTVQAAAALLAGARVVVGLDTGFSHVAAALGVPVVGIYCDHEPGLTGITGSAPGASLGGKGQRPSLSAVLQALSDVQSHPHQSSSMR